MRLHNTLKDRSKRPRLINSLICRSEGATERRHVRTVYFLSNSDLSRVKIGKATRTSTRVRAVQAGSAEQLLLVAEVDGYTHVERWFHDRFATRRIHNEWFVVDDELGKTIAEIQRAGRGASRHLCPDAFAKDLPPQINAHTKLTPEIVEEARCRYDRGESITALIHRFSAIKPLDLSRAVFGLTWQQLAPTTRKPPDDLRRLLQGKYRRVS
jgi:hypothetical protein